MSLGFKRTRGMHQRAYYTTFTNYLFRAEGPLSQLFKETTMAEEIRRVDYYYATVPDKAGEAAHTLSALHRGGVNLLAFSGFPAGARKGQLDFIAEDSAALTNAARSARIKLSRKRSGFLIQGEDRPGAVADILGKLAEAGINVTAALAVCAGMGRYGGLIWVKPTDLRKAAKALGVG